MTDVFDERPMSFDGGRRRFIAAAAVLAPALWLPARGARAGQAPRKVRMFHTHTGEKLALTYHVNGDYLDDALHEVDRFLRDFRSGEVHPINPALLDRLHVMRKLTGGTGNFEIISAFRSPSTNEMLRNASASSGVAKKSHHMSGNALDVRLAGIDTRMLRDAAKSLKAGGVGYYASSDFIHIDTGRVRAW